MNLPDYDQITGLHCSIGMYALSRLPARLSEQIEFLKAVAEKFGEGSHVHYHEPSDGYPGYIAVTPWSKVSRKPASIFGERAVIKCFGTSGEIE